VVHVEVAVRLQWEVVAPRLIAEAGVKGVWDGSPSVIELISFADELATSSLLSRPARSWELTVLLKLPPELSFLGGISQAPSRLKDA
jgi:hypothetical protein